MVTRADGRFGRYELLELLGAGTLGEVYRARVVGAEGSRTHVAVKRIYPHLCADSDYRELFLRAAEIATELRHPNIVQVLDLGICDGGLFVAMEYVRGLGVASLAHRLGMRGTSLAPGVAAVIAFDVLDALDCAHGKGKTLGDAHGIVHQDVSPQNILLEAESGLAKLSDFGIVRPRGDQGATPDAVLGKVAYMAPEQARGEALDGRVDVFAVGAVLFRLLADRPLLGDIDEDQRLSSCRRGELGDIKGALAEVEPRLTSIVECALEPRPRDRYADAAAMRTELEAWLVGLDPVGQRARLKQMVTEATAERGASLGEHVAGDVTTVSQSEGWVQLVRRASEITGGSDAVHAERPATASRSALRSSRARAVGVGVAIAASTAVAGVWMTRSARTRDEAPPAASDVATQPVEAVPPPDPRAAESQAPLRPARQAQSHRTRRQAPGSLTLDAIPWAKVTVDGKLLPKRTPIVKLKLSSGKHTVVLEGPQRRETLVVTIRPRRTLTKVVDLRAR